MKTPHKKANQSAFTLVELTVAMSVMAMLLVSMGTAINGAMKNYEDNTQAYSLNQSVRIIGERMAREIRSADNAQVFTNQLILDMPGSPDQILYSLNGGILYYTSVDGIQQTDSTLLGAEDDFSVQAFTIEMNVRDIEGTDYAILVIAKIDILVDEEIRSFTFSASLRKNKEGF